jgi:hypothetical protein
MIVGPWDRAAFAPSAGGYAILELTDQSGTITVAGYNVSRSEVLAVARSLRRDETGGWTPAYVPADLRLVHQGWNLGVASRTLEWVENGVILQELTVARGAPSLFQVGGASGIGFVNGQIAATFEYDDGSAVAWNLAPDVVARLGFKGPLDKALDIAASVTAVDRATWLASSTLNTSTEECSSMFC